MSTIGINQLKRIVEMDNHSFKDSLINELKGLIKIRETSDGASASHLYSIYATRYHINQTVTTFEGVQGWLPLVPNLEKVAQDKNAKICSISVTTENAKYLHLLSENLETLHGVLKFTAQKIDRKKELETDGTLKGTWYGYDFFDNEAPVKSRV